MKVLTKTKHQEQVVTAFGRWLTGWPATEEYQWALRHARFSAATKEGLGGSFRQKSITEMNYGLLSSSLASNALSFVASVIVKSTNDRANLLNNGLAGL